MDVPTDEEEFGSGSSSNGGSIGETGLSPRTAAAAAREKRSLAQKKREERRSRSPVDHLMELELPTAGEVKFNVAEGDESEEREDSTSAISDDPPTGAQAWASCSLLLAPCGLWLAARYLLLATCSLLRAVATL